MDGLSVTLSPFLVRDHSPCSIGVTVSIPQPQAHKCTATLYFSDMYRIPSSFFCGKESKYKGLSSFTLAIASIEYPSEEYVEHYSELSIQDKNKPPPVVWQREQGKHQKTSEQAGALYETEEMPSVGESYQRIGQQPCDDLIL